MNLLEFHESQDRSTTKRDMNMKQAHAKET